MKVGHETVIEQDVRPARQVVDKVIDTINRLRAAGVTISIDDTPAGATLRIEWGTKSATTPFTVG